MDKNILNEVLMEHKRWVESEGQDGKRANLSDANLSGADLSGVDLTGAKLWDADLSHANLFRADLSYADLSHANLFGANLSYSDLSCANLFRADLSHVNLFRVDLSQANLFKADLSRANLSGANLSGADLLGVDLNNVKWNEITAFIDQQCPEEGSFVAYKKCRGDVIVKLLIPEDAKRSSGASRKCRCDKAIVLEIVDHNGDQIKTARSKYNGDFIYKVGKTVKVDNFDEDRWKDCSTGIHFFITRAEAEKY